MSTPRHVSGFTLVEVLIAFAVTFVVLALLMSMTSDMLRFAEEEQMQNAIERETALLLDYLKRDVKAARVVYTSFPNTSPSAQVLVFELPEFDDAGCPLPNTFDYVVYAHDSDEGEVTRTVYNDAAGLEPLTSTALPARYTSLTVFADGDPIESLPPGETVRNLQISLSRSGDPDGRFQYSRTLVATSTLRNSD